MQEAVGLGKMVAITRQLCRDHSACAHALLLTHLCMHAVSVNLVLPSYTTQRFCQSSVNAVRAPSEPISDYFHSLQSITALVVQ